MNKNGIVSIVSLVALYGGFLYWMGKKYDKYMERLIPESNKEN